MGLPATEVDRILVSVIGNRFDAISKEIGQTMLRTSRSYGRPSKFRSMKYCCNSGRRASSRKRMCPSTG